MGSIIHITPQNPNFTTYSDDFKRDYLNNIGNLVLMVWGDNSEKRNNNPIDKVNLFDSDYYSHKEIRDVLSSEQNWSEQEIQKRKNKLLKFVFDNWGM